MNYSFKIIQSEEINHSWSTIDLFWHNTTISPLKSLSNFIKQEKNKLNRFNNWFLKHQIKLIELYIKLENFDKYKLANIKYKTIIENDIIDFAKSIFDTWTYLPIMYNDDMLIEFKNDLSYRTYEDRYTLAHNHDIEYSQKNYKTAWYYDQNNPYRNIWRKMKNIRFWMEEWKPE